MTSVQAPTCQKYLQPLTLGCNEAWFSYVTNAPSIGVFGYLLSKVAPPGRSDEGYTNLEIPQALVSTWSNLVLNRAGESGQRSSF